MARTRLASAVVVYLATLLLTLPTGPMPASSQAQEVARVPVGSTWPGERPWQIDVSDDGRHVVFQTHGANGWTLHLADLESGSVREIPGLGDTPYFGTISPDGRWLLFGKKARIWKTPLEGGDITLVHAANLWKAWETTESILVSKGTGGIWRVRADGSRAEELVAAVDTATGATNYHRPGLLPGGRGVLVSVGLGTGTDLRRVGVVSFSDGRLTLLDETGINPRWAASGHILFTRESTLMAVPFDLESLRPRGPAVPVVEGIQIYSNLASQFDISLNGVLVYVPGPSMIGRVMPRTLVWVDRMGGETPFDTQAEKFFGRVALSPDRRYVAAGDGTTLLLFDRRSGAWSTLVESGRTSDPVWASDGRTLYFTRDGSFGRHAVGDGGGGWEEIRPGRPDSEFLGLSLDGSGTRALGIEWNPQTRFWRMVGLPLADEPTLQALPGETSNLRNNPVVSPDGAWLAYVEKVEGLDRVYVERFPEGGEPLLVSEGATGEAAEPVWGRTSAELFYRDATHLVAVRLEASPALRVVKTSRLFATRPYYGFIDTFAPTYDYDPATDRFLMARWSLQDAGTEDLHVVRDGFGLLNRLAPGR